MNRDSLDQDLVRRLYARQTHGIKPGLGNTRKLLAKLGNPEDGLGVVHVAGTNGKGSVCAMVAAGLQTTGLPIGLTISPHLVRFNERFRINGEPISDAALGSLLEEVEQVAELLEREDGTVPTFFECSLAVALLHFKRNNVRLAVVEVGLGGRLDATNVLTPLLSVITRIGMDHTEYLGTTLEEVAGEKAGIIKPQRPVVMGAMPAAAANVIRRTAAERNSHLIDAAAVSIRRIAGDLGSQKLHISSQSREYGTVAAALAASYQVENIATAVAAMEALESPVGLPLPEDAVISAIGKAQWEGRFQLIKPSPPVMVDGAHNPDGAAALAKALHDAKTGRALALVCGFCADKDVDGFFRVMAPLAKTLWTVPIDNPRSLSPENSAAVAARYRLAAMPHHDLSEALAEAEAWARTNHGLVVVCGSLYLVGEVLSLMR